MELQHTMDFLKAIAADVVNEKINYEDLVKDLKSSMLSDGFGRIQYLRGLHESVEGPNNPDFGISLFLVFLCVLCAGFASGLTQVAAFLLSSHSLFSSIFISLFRACFHLISWKCK